MLTALREIINDRNAAPQAALLTRFSNLYYANVPADELLARPATDLYGATLSSWHFVQQRQTGEAKVRVFNPDHENHGWQCSHTVVEVVCEDMPFLVDSIRLQLNSRQMSLHALHYCVLYARRDNKQQLDNSIDWSVPSEGGVAEALVYMEFDHHSDPAILSELNEALKSVLAEVKCCVDDFPKIMKRLEVAATELAASKQEGTNEGEAFLRWLSLNHFTFLASDEFSFEHDKDGDYVVRDGSQDLGVFRFRQADRDRLRLQDLPEEIHRFITNPQPISFMKSGERSRVHRPAYPDYVVVKRFDKTGKVIGGIRFMGLYTSIVYIETPNNIPIVRNKLADVRARANFTPGSHSAKELNRILEVYPRDDLFQSTVDQLHRTAISILNIQERRQTRIYLRKDPYSKFVSCLAYVPRDIYNTDLRQRIEGVLRHEFAPLDIESTTYFSESVLARAQYTLRLDSSRNNDFDEIMVARKIRQVVRSWQDDLHDALIEQVGEELGNRQFVDYRSAFPAGYRENFTSRTAVTDIQYIENLCVQSPVELGMSFYRELEEDSNQLHFKLFHRDSFLPLSDVIPVLENLGLRVLGEHPFEIIRRDGKVIWIHNFLLQYTLSDSINIAEVKALFQDSFRAIWQGRAENDPFNRLVLGGQLGWKDIALLRAYARYMKQIRFGISESYIAETLSRYISLSARLVKLFHARFGLGFESEDARNEAFAAIEADILGKMDTVSQLNEDRTIRRYIELIRATLRTNFFQHGDDGEPKSYISLKMNPAAISEMPLPRPMFEIFVYSPRVEGVHLRGGRVARGGLRWSDRADDFRTEVLGLVKAQQVKNAVIVPVGAKGGFIAKNLPKDGGRDAFMAEGIACYQTFVSALLDVTDNLVDGAVVPPERVVRHDADDTYLVVAADKGTATFSDIANEIAVTRGFWLGDAFASGGSIGYDHKKMGITARGAWVSVQRHFREQGLNVQTTDFSVVGIGDMAGDVFGNGMLRSEHICLVAAFNHMHIFVDPTPDAAASFVERKRLFELPRSAWSDYDSKLISKGGGVFLRSAKSIPISDEMKALFEIREDRLAPNDLINYILKARVDLIWNGGIGTYVKAASERHSQVGDKANDGLRVIGGDLRARVVGEGGNLGMTQLGRIEFALKGGASYTDFIDNAGGVDCSDHEVNIKIMLNEVVASGDLTRKQRNEIFMAMTEEVGELVVQDNYRQTQAISLAYKDCLPRMEEYVRLMKSYESKGKLNRALEFLPDDETLVNRKASGVGLTRPELAVLISYTKADLKEQLNHPDIYEDAYVAEILTTAFPSELAKRFGEPLRNHRLRREIIATQLANDMVNYMGINFMHRLSKSTGSSVADVARAYVAARDIFALDDYWKAINELDYKVSTVVQEDMMADLMRLVRRATRWFVRNRRASIHISVEVERFRAAVAGIAAEMGTTLRGTSLERWQQSRDERIAQGVPAELASYCSGAVNLYSALGIVEAAVQTGQPVNDVAVAYFEVGEQLSLNWFGQQINGLPATSHWEALARESLRDDLDWQQRSLTVGVMTGLQQGEALSAALERWQNDQSLLFSRWQTMLADLKATDHMEFAMVAVALRELLDLAQASRQQADCPPCQ
ncbi:NAD-glutamate dehydrogenase [Parathalassolituus penaei]|uniref:NAD-glutamate dehydrogenase n=1 Tax=Parathalassolituus penaei TaxID=2997323 RepID=A0A9X3IUT0_9GAMM|nr:NAD-glutamate dehydrogenase [Parathalassolituus penaei]MCY0966503.1 NAD-glutamate dehydrogenase [Parathalassolituus penaei]